MKYTGIHNFLLKTNRLIAVFLLARARPNKRPDVLNIPSGEEALFLDEVRKERAVVPSRNCGAGLQVAPSLFVIALRSNAWRLAESYLITNRQMVNYLRMLTKLKASHWFCVQGVSCGTRHRRKGRHELRHAARSGSLPTGRIFVTFPVVGFY